MNLHPWFRPVIAVSLAAFVSLAAAAAGRASAGRASDDGMSERASQISLRSGIIDTGAAKHSVPAHLQAGLAAGSGDYVLVKYPAPVSAEQHRALEAVAERVYTYLPHFAYLVRMPPGFDRESSRTALGASWIGPYHPVYKLSPRSTTLVPSTVSRRVGGDGGRGGAGGPIFHRRATASCSSDSLGIDLLAQQLLSSPRHGSPIETQ